MFGPSHRARGLLAAAAGAVIMTGCTSSVPHPHGSMTTQPASPATPRSRTPAASPTSTAATPAILAKPDFITKADALCNDTYAKVQTLPTPSSPTDYPALIAYTKTVLKLYPPFSSTIKALIAQAADKDELTAKWIALDDANYNAQKPLLEQLLTAATAKQADRVRQLEDQLDSAPDDSDTVAAFLDGYGLTDCAKLESS